MASSQSAAPPMLSVSRSVISGGSFNQHNEFHVHGGTKGGFEYLKEAVAPGAFHNSGERFDPPKCHPKTRVAVMKKIMGWILGQDSDARNALIMWLNGAAGAGKSAIAQSIAELCYSEGRLLASFFFGRSDPNRNHARALLATISYQIALALPQIREKLAATIEYDPLIFTRSLSAQFLSLIVEPLRDLSNSGFFNNSSSPHLIIVDGLDECLDWKVRSEILDVIASGVQQHRLPLIFLIASRPEHDISTKFSSARMKDISTRLILDDSCFPDDDIKLFLRDKFTEIKETHPFKQAIPTAWPADDVIKSLVRKSSGQFIYASTVVKYVESSRHRPHQRLEVILSLRAARGDLPFAELDALYTYIFASVEEVDQILDVISFYLLGNYRFMRVHDVEKILSLDCGDIDLLFCDLGSLISIRATGSTQKDFVVFQILHASLSDFLLDKSRSNQLHIDSGLRSTQHVRTCFRFLACSDVILTAAPFTDHGAHRMAMEFITSNYNDCIPSTELQDDVLGFSIGRIYEEPDLDVIWHSNGDFLPTFFAKLKDSKFKNADKLYTHHLDSFDEASRHQLQNYYADSLLVALVGFIRIKRPQYFESRYPDIWELDKNFQLFDLDQALLDNDRKKCRFLYDPTSEYLQLISEFLEDPRRSGLCALDGEKYATAALTTLRYLCDHHSAPQTVVPRYTQPEMEIRRGTPWMWHRRRGRRGALDKSRVWRKKQGDYEYEYEKVNNKLGENMENPVTFQRVWSEKYSFGLEYLLFFLPRSVRSEELIKFASRHTFASRSQEFPVLSKKARRAIAEYLERMEGE